MRQKGSCHAKATVKGRQKWLPRLCLLLPLAAMLINVVEAEETKRTWTLVDSEGASHGQYTTQEQAAAAITELPPPNAYVPEFYKYADQIRSQEILENGDVKITYWNGKELPTDPKWMYVGDQDYSTEEEAIRSLEQIANESNSPCPATAKITLLGNWQDSRTDGNDGSEWGEKAYRLDYNYLGADECLPKSEEMELARHRRTECPVEKLMSWRDKYQACVNEYAVAFVVTKTLERGCGYEGNPCDTKTGDKYEIASDFDLGWIALERHYHSGISNDTGGFGYGWTHSHAIRLTIGDASIGLIDGGGFHTRYHRVGDAYFASDSSGDRLIANGTLWKLYRKDAVLIFDADGKLLERESRDGTFLHYDYDDLGRLTTIIHSSGRTLDFHYLSATSGALIGAITTSGIPLVTYTYTQRGQVDTATYPDGTQKLYHYEEPRFPGNLTGYTGEDGQRFSTFAYDDVGRAISSQHAGGIDGITLAYSAAGTRVTDTLGDVNDYTMTEAGGASPKVAAVARTDGTLQYSYNDQSSDFRRRLSSVTDRRGIQTQHSYAEATENGVAVNIHTVREAVGQPQERTTTTRTAADSNRLLSVQTGGRTVSYSYNDRLQPVQMTSTDTATGKQRTLTYSYCEAADVAATDSTCPILGLPKTVDGSRTDVNDITRFTYYPTDDSTCTTSPTTCPHRKGDLWKVTNALGQVTEYLSYDGAGRVLSAKDANGVITDFTYHPRGWLTASKVRGADDSSESDDRITSIDYWPTGLVKQVTQPDGAFTRFTYDAAHRLTDIADNAGNTIHYTLDNAGNRSKEDTKDASGTLKRTLSRVYNQLGQLATQATAQGDPTDFGYDGNGNTKTVTDALGHATQNDYDPLNRLARTLQDVGGIAAETKFGYDALDNLTKVTDPKGLDTTYAYNGLGDLTKLTSPDTGSTTYTYDSAGNRATQTDARNIKTSYGYDALNRLTQVTYPTTSLNVSYTYDVS